MIIRKDIQPLLLLLLLVNFISCHTHKYRREFPPKEYHLPINLIGSGKTFVYTKLQSPGDTGFNDLQVITESGMQYLLSKRYSSYRKFDSIKYTTDYNTVESFYCISRDSLFKSTFWVKGEVKENEFIDNGMKFLKHISEATYSGNVNILTSNEQLEYLNDTVLTWQGKKVDCIAGKIKTTQVYTRKENPLDTIHEMDFAGDIYYAKGIGMLLEIGQINNQLSGWKLVDIRDTK